MLRILSNLLHAAPLAPQEVARIRDEAVSESVSRLHKLTVLFVLINLGYTYFFWRILPSAGNLALRDYHHTIGVIHGVSAVVVSAIWPWLHWLCRTPGAHPLAERWARGLLGAWALFFGIALSVADQWVSNNTTNYAMACLFVAMVWLLRPVSALVFLGSAYVALHQLLAWAQHDASLLSMARNHGFASTLLSIVIATMIWRQFIEAAVLRHALSRSNEALEKKQQELSYLATHDPLTGLRNRRAFLLEAEHELSRALRYPCETGVLVADLDHFKRINDHYGHPAGDAVLQHFAQLLKTQLRESDIAARLGGEEFIVLLPGTGATGTTVVAEKIRQALEVARIVHADQSIGMTVSIGVSCLPAHSACTIEALYARADQALYAAKTGGRNRVVQLDGPPPQSRAEA